MEQMRQRIRRAWEYKLGSVRGLTLRQKPGADDCGFELFTSDSWFRAQRIKTQSAYNGN